MYATRRRRPRRSYVRRTRFTKRSRPYYKRRRFSRRRSYKIYEKNKKYDYCNVRFLKDYRNYEAVSTNVPGSGNANPAQNCLAAATGVTLTTTITQITSIYNGPNVGGVINGAIMTSSFSSYVIMYRHFKISRITVYCRWNKTTPVVVANSLTAVGSGSLTAGFKPSLADSMFQNAVLPPNLDQVGWGAAGNNAWNNSASGQSFATYWGTNYSNNGMCCVYYPGITDSAVDIPNSDADWLNWNGIRRYRIGKPFKIVCVPKIRTSNFSDPLVGVATNQTTYTIRKMPWFTTGTYNPALQLYLPTIKTIGNMSAQLNLLTTWVVHYKFKNKRQQ